MTSTSYSAQEDSRNDELLFRRSRAGGAGGGGCYEEFRSNVPEDFNLTVESCRMSVSLMEDLRRGQYKLNYRIRVDGERPETDWFFVIPFSQGLVTEAFATDHEGGLEYLLKPVLADKTMMVIKYRHAVSKGGCYEFTFGYQTSIVSVFSNGALTSVVTYSDWCSHNNPCDHLDISISLPSQSSPIQTVPPADLTHNPINFSTENRRPLESFNFVVAYRRHKVNKQFWIWLGSAIGTGLVGALLRSLLG